MLAPKGSTFNGRPTFANPMYLKKAQSENPCLYEIPYDTSDLANVFSPDREETCDTTIRACIIYIKAKNVNVLAEKHLNKTKNVSKEVYNGLLRSFAKLEKQSISLELALKQCQEQLKNDTVYKENASTVFLKEREQYHEIQDLKFHLQDKNIAITPQLSQTSRNTDPQMSTSTGVIYKTNVIRPQLRSTQMKDKVVPNNSQVKFKKTEVEDHHRISTISNKTKSVTACNDSLKSIISNVNVVCATCGKCVFNSNHNACVSKFLNDVNATTKKPKVETIITRQPKSQANKSVATPPKKTVASESTIHKSKSYYRMLYEKTRFNLSSVPSSSNSLADCSTESYSLLTLDAQKHRTELDLLFGPLYDEFFTVGTSSVNKSSSPSVNSQQQDTQPIVNIHPTTKLITPTTIVHDEETNDNQAEDATHKSDNTVYPKDSGFELTAFLDVDHDGCLNTRKSTSGGIHLLGDKLVSWMSKKQDCTECHQQKRSTLRYLQFVLKTEYQLADMFTKALPEDRFHYLVRQIGMRCLTPTELEVLVGAKIMIFNLYDLFMF
ncbi:hypothetical protein Tco_0169827 [Tanacetum coccineum]